MRKTLFLLLSLVCRSLAATAQAQSLSEVWQPDCGDGTYRNPVLYADYSDPDVCAVGENYYLTASSFQCTPGLPILHSRDLVNWHIIGHALPTLAPAADFKFPQHGKGVWAPAIRHHDGHFYIYWGDPDRGIFMVRSERAEGPWEPPVCVIAGRGMIDPCPLWDEDGRCYLINAWAASRAGFNSVLTVRELSADGTRVTGLPRIVFDGGQVNHTTEGPKFYRHDGYYWIMCPAGGVAMGWQLAMRSRSPYGPYEWRRVMAQGTTDINGPHQGAWVHTPQGEDWFLHFNDKGAYGRVVYLQPMVWKGGWPVIGNDPDGDGCGEPYASYRKPKTTATERMNPQESDDFDGGTLGPQWQWHANYNQTYGMPTADGFMRLYTIDLPSLGEGKEVSSLWAAPNLLLQKPTAPRFTATAKVRMAAKAEGQWGGLVMMGRSYSALVALRRGDAFVVQRRTCIDAEDGKPESAEDIIELKPTAADTIPYAPAIYLDLYLRIVVDDGQCRYAYSTDGRRFKAAGEPFAMREGKWIGAKFGFVAESDAADTNRGWLDIDWIKITK